MKTYFHIIKNSRKIQVVLLVGCLIQIIFCITSVGYFHPDQHFQIIEFSSHQLNKPNAASAVWELASNIRPTFQVYVFSAFQLIFNFLSINNPFYQLTIIRVFQGLLFWFILNLLVFFYGNKKPANTLFITLFILNFSWFLPYSRTIFSSEIVSALIFFPTITFFYRQYLNNKTNFTNSFIVGIILAFSFFLRFQIAFAIVGFGFWILFLEKKIKLTAYILIGAAIGLLLNVLLDYGFYHKLVFTPYLYFKVNILQGVAASFGEKGFMYYVGVLIGVVTVAPISIIILYQYTKTSVKNIKNPLVLSVLFFILGHFIVGHKEERFMFTIINILPIVLLLNENSFNFLLSSFKWKRIIKPVLYFSLCLNFILLVLFTFNPYSQSIHFIDLISNQLPSKTDKVFCISRTPLQTESHLPLTYYKLALGNTNFINTNNIDSISNLHQNTIWLTGTFNDLKENFSKIDSMGYQPIVYSSTMLWNINTFLLKKKINTINDIWVLYKLKK